MTDSGTPTTPAERILLLLDRTPVAADALAQALLIPRDVALDVALRASTELTLSDLVAAAEVLDVPVTVLTGQVAMERDLAVSLRLGLAQQSGAPAEALAYAEAMLGHLSLLDAWFGRVESHLSRLPVSYEQYFLGAGESTAGRVRDLLHLGDEPIADLVTLVERCGIPVAFQPLPEGVHGLTVRQQRADSVDRVVLVSTRDQWTRQRFTLAHELCHGLYDDEGQVIVDHVDVPETLPELRAEAFARHLLLPKASLKKEVRAARRERLTLVQLVAALIIRYGVSRNAVVKALIDDRHASEDDVREIRSSRLDMLMASAGLADEWAELSADEHDPSGSPWLVERAIDAYSRGWIDVAVVAELLNEDVEATQERLRANGWTSVS